VSAKKTFARQRVQVSRGNPGYHGRLPHVFPYYWEGGLEEVQNLAERLMDNSVTGFVEDEHWGLDEVSASGAAGLWFAVTGHPKTVDGHVTLWLSSQAAQWLLRMGMVASVCEYAKV
jgi:hypothetical protein